MLNTDYIKHKSKTWRKIFVTCRKMIFQSTYSLLFGFIIAPRVNFPHALHFAVYHSWVLQKFLIVLILAAMYTKLWTKSKSAVNYGYNNYIIQQYCATNRLKRYYKNYSRRFFIDLKRHQRICNISVPFN